LHLSRQWRNPTGKYKQTARSNIATAAYLAILLFPSPSEERRHSELESAKCPPPVERIHESVPVFECQVTLVSFKVTSQAGNPPQV
jgi:hypothetical protein